MVLAKVLLIAVIAIAIASGLIMRIRRKWRRR